jgi:hypothetical protein
MIERREDWEERLNDYVASVFNEPHEWGKHDCAIFTCDAVLAMTGVDIMPEFRGKYSSEAEARELIVNSGNSDLAGVMETRLPRVPRPSVQRGDVVMVKGGNLGIAYGDVALCVGEDQLTGKVGIIRIPREDWRKAWHVG